MKNYVYSFGGGTADGDGKMKEVLGGKGAGLAEMCRAGVPVPPGFTISTEVCNIYFENKNSVPAEINQQVLNALAKLEGQIGKKLGDPKNPLLVSVRSGARFSMPGMMNTILNLGLERCDYRGAGEADGESAVRLRFLPALHSDVRRSGAGYRYGEVRPHLRCAQGTRPR